jgi:transcriptional regulator with XRE-family HTH domain
LRDWLYENDKSQEWLAKQIGAFQTSVSRWCRGASTPRSLEHAIALERVTGIPAKAWLAEELRRTG